MALAPTSSRIVGHLVPSSRRPSRGYDGDWKSAMQAMEKAGEKHIKVSPIIEHYLRRKVRGSTAERPCLSATYDLRRRVEAVHIRFSVRKRFCDKRGAAYPALTLASPKSTTLTYPSASMTRFSGFKSLYAIFFACM